MKRVLVIGVSGAGKSTLAKRLAECTGLPYVATDPFYWEADWQCAPPHRVRRQVDKATAGEKWILDGNFDSERALVWTRAEIVVWLDLPLPLVLLRVVCRNVKLLISQEATWSGNRMTWRKAWSGIRHCVRSYGSKRREYPSYLSEFPHLDVLRFGRPSEVSRWLRGLSVKEDSR